MIQKKHRKDYMSDNESAVTNINDDNESLYDSDYSYEYDEPYEADELLVDADGCSYYHDVHDVQDSHESNMVADILLPLVYDNVLLDDIDLEILSNKLKDKNKTTPVISFLNCRIGDTGIKVLVKALKANESVRTINLINNDITKNGALNLIDVFQENVSILNVYLDNNPIPQDALNRIDEYLQRNQKINAIKTYLNNLSELPTVDVDNILRNYIEELETVFPRLCEPFLERNFHLPLMIKEMYLLLNALRSNTLKDWAIKPETLFLELFLNNHVPNVLNALKQIEDVKLHLFVSESNVSQYIENLSAIFRQMNAPLTGCGLPKALKIAYLLLKKVLFLKSSHLKPDDGLVLLENPLEIPDEQILTNDYLAEIFSLLSVDSKVKKIWMYLHTLNHLGEYDDICLSNDINDLITCCPKLGEQSELPMPLKETWFLLCTLKQFRCGEILQSWSSSSFKTKELEKFSNDVQEMLSVLQSINESETGLVNVLQINKKISKLKNHDRIERDNLIRERSVLIKALKPLTPCSAWPIKLLSKIYYLQHLRQFKAEDCGRADLNSMLEKLSLKFSNNLNILDENLVSDGENKKIREIQSYLKDLNFNSPDNNKLLHYIDDLEKICPNIGDPSERYMFPAVLMETYDLLCALKEFKLGFNRSASMLFKSLRARAFKDTGSNLFLHEFASKFLMKINFLKSSLHSLDKAKKDLHSAYTSKHIHFFNTISPSYKVCNEWPDLSINLKLTYIFQCLDQILKTLEIPLDLADHPMLEDHASEIFSLLYVLHEIQHLKRYLHNLNNLKDYEDTVLSKNIYELEIFYPEYQRLSKQIEDPLALKEMYFLLCELKQFKFDRNKAFKNWAPILQTYEFWKLSHKLLPETIPLMSVFLLIRGMQNYLYISSASYNDSEINKYAFRLKNKLLSFSEECKLSNIFNIGHIVLEALYLFQSSDLRENNINDLLKQLSVHLKNSLNSENRGTFFQVLPLLYTLYFSLRIWEVDSSVLSETIDDLNAILKAVKHENLNNDAKLSTFLDELYFFLCELKILKTGKSLNVNQIEKKVFQSAHLQELQRNIKNYKQGVETVTKKIQPYLNSLDHVDSYDDALLTEHLKISYDMLPEKPELLRNTYSLLQAIQQLRLGNLYQTIKFIEYAFESQELKKFSDELLSLMLMTMDPAGLSIVQKRSRYFLLCFSTKKVQTSLFFKTGIIGLRSDSPVSVQTLQEEFNTYYLDYDDMCVLIKNALKTMENPGSPEGRLFKFTLSLGRYDNSIAELLTLSPTFKQHVIENYPDIENICFLENYLLSLTKGLSPMCWDLNNTYTGLITEEMIANVSCSTSERDEFELLRQTFWNEYKRYAKGLIYSPAVFSEMPEAPQNEDILKADEKFSALIVKRAASPVFSQDILEKKAKSNDDASYRPSFGAP